MPLLVRRGRRNDPAHQSAGKRAKIAAMKIDDLPHLRRLLTKISSTWLAKCNRLRKPLDGVHSVTLSEWAAGRLTSSVWTHDLPFGLILSSDWAGGRVAETVSTTLGI